MDVAEGLILAERKFAVRGKLEHADEPGRLVFQVFPLSQSQENREEETLKISENVSTSEKVRKNRILDEDTCHGDFMTL